MLDSYGRSAVRVPHFDGWLPICSSRVPPFMMSLYMMYDLLYGLPFSFADCTYMFSLLLFLQTMLKVLPLPTFSSALSKIGLPMM